MQNENQEMLSNEKIGKLMQAYARRASFHCLSAHFTTSLPALFRLRRRAVFMPVSDILTAVLSAVIIIRTFRSLKTENPAGIPG